MDGGCLTDIGKTLVEKLLNNAIEKSRNIFCFTCIVKEFNEEKEKLEAESATIREQFQVATNKGKGIKSNAQFWEERVGELIQENTETKKSCFFGFCPDCKWRYKRGEELSTKTEEIRKLMKVKFENVELDRPLPGVERYSSQGYIPFKSRELKYEELLAALRDDSNYITGLQGMGGTGKTTFSKQVGKQLKTSEQFNHVIDTTVSFTPDIKKIQDDIAGPLGLKWEDISESDRPKKLWSRLTNGEKILLILDDVWENLNFDDIGIPKSDNHKGCKLLVTTRNLWVCDKMECEKTIQLDLLNEEEAWSMFKLHANLTDNSSQSILKKGRKIATECKGLPVAIAAVASSLKGQKRHGEWDFSLKTLQKPLSKGSVGNDSVDIYKCLKLSYDFLKDKKAEGLFILCSTFPEDEEISTEVLTRLGIGIGLFEDDYVSYEDARSQAVASKNKLLDSCLLLETEEGDVKMHDLVREVAQLIANNEMKIVNFSNKNQKSQVERDKKIKYLTCEGNLRDLFASKFDGSELKILIGNIHMEDILDIPISFFENIPKLRVLNLSRHSAHWDKKQHPLSLPQSMKPLLNIRSLSFEKVDLGDISVFGGLQSLETLELTLCAINELPREIENLENFRLLELKECKIRNNNPFEVIQRCTSLEELYFCHSFNDFCKEITLPPTLQRYHLNNCEFVVMKDTISRGVSLEGIDFFHLSEATLKSVMEAIEFFHLEGTQRCRNLMPGIVPIDNGMNDLIELYVGNCYFLQCLVDTKHINFQVPSVFSSLKNVTLKSCSMLVSVFDLSTSRGLLQLEKLEISDCERLESIIITDCDIDNNNSCNSVFPNLKFLWIEKCPQLQSILPCHSAGDFLLLESIMIDKCDELKYIFGQHQDVQLASLEVFRLDDVPNFIDIFPEPSSIKGSSDSISKPQAELETVKSNTFSWSQICCYGYKLRGSTSTKIALVSENQPKDCSITLKSSSYYPNIWERAQCLSTSRLSHILCNIKKMLLYDLPKIKSVFVMSIASKLSLDTLIIERCKELEHILVDIEDDSGGNNWGNNVFPKLKELNVDDCEKLEYIIGHIDHHQNHNNQVTHLHLPALECLKLDNLPSVVGICTKHYCTMLPALTEVELVECSKVDITSIGDFIVANYSNKELSVNVEHFLSLEKLKVHDSKVENIFCLNEVSEQQMNFGLQDIELHNLPMMTCLFKGLKNYFSLKNLTKLNIKGCEKLEIVFSTSIIMCLPQLLHIRIEECKELKHMIEDDLENRQTVCFPKLKTVIVEKCKMLKNVFPISICKELPELEVLIIRESDELEEIFVCYEGDEKVNIPNLKFVAFVNLPSLCQTQGIHFQAVRCHSIQHCKNFSLTSAPREDIRNYRDYFFDQPEWRMYMDIYDILEQLQKETRDCDTYNENPSSKTTEDIAAGIEVQVASGHMMTSSQELLNEQSKSQQCLMDKRHLPGEIDTIVKPFMVNNTVELNFEDIDNVASQETTQTNNNQVSLNNEVVMKVSLNVEDTIASSIESQFPSIPTKDFDMYLHMESLFQRFQEVSKGHSIGNGNQSAQTAKEFAAWIEAEAASWHELTSSKELMNEQQSLGEIETSIKSCQETNLEGSASEKLAGATLSTISGTINEPPTRLVAPKQKGNEISFEEGTTSTCDKTITSSTHLEVVDRKTCIPFSSIVNIIKLPSTKYVDIGASHETFDIEDIDKLIKEDSVLAFETSLLHGLNQHQGLLPSDVNEFVEKVKNFFNDIINKHATYQQLLTKHKQLLDLKPGLLKKLLSAKSKQLHIVSETSTANAQIHKRSLEIDELRKQLEDLENQIDDLKSVVNKCDVQKEELNAECSEWAQQSKEFASALASTEVDLREAERSRNLATEGFSNLMSSFTTF